MTLTNPIALFWGLLAVAIVVFYFRKIRPPQHRGSVGFLWQRVVGPIRPRSLWQPWRHPVALCVQLVILAAVVLALAEPYFGCPRRVVLVVDNSASMNAADAEPSRLARARQLGLELIGALGYRDQMAIVAAGNPLRILCGMTSRKKSLQEAIRAVPATEGPTRVDEAVRLARWLLGDAPGRQIVILTDACFPAAATLARDADIRLVRVGKQTGNLAVTRLAARRTLPEDRRCQVLAEVTNFSTGAATCGLRLALDDEPIDVVQLELAASERWQRVFEFTSAQPVRISAELDGIAPPDVFLDDNRASVRIPLHRSYQVTLVTEGSLYLKNVFAACPAVKLTVSESPPATYDRETITVFDGRVPRRLPGGPVLVVDPAGSCDLWRLGEPVADPVVARQEEAWSLLADARLVGVSLAGARRLALAEAARPLARPLAWTADGVPLGYGIRRPGGRVLVLSGNLEAGNLAQRTAFPILISNALAWLTEPDSRRVGRAERDPKLSSADESDLCAEAIPLESDSPAIGPPGPPLWLYCAALALILAVADWCLYERRWTC